MEYYHQAHLHIITEKNPTPDITLYHLLDIVARTDTDIADQGRSPILTNIKVTVVMTPTYAVGTVNATIRVLPNAVTPVLVIFAVTHHITDHPHIGVLQHIQEITADPDHVLHINQVRKFSINFHSNIAELLQNLKIEGIPESQ